MDNSKLFLSSGAHVNKEPVIIRTPAKVNLSLRVVGRRKDGYHLIDTLMVPVSLYDEIRISKQTGPNAARRNSLEVKCNYPGVPSGKNNLVYKAASLLLGDSPQGVRIEVRKRIPVGAGLGGGSSDAAATLVGLNRLLRLGHSLKKLRQLAVTLGADVPFFIRPRPCRARGIGENLTSVRKLPRLWLVILYPGFAVSSARVYRQWRRKLTKSKVNTSISASLGDSAKLSLLLVNDLESITMRCYPRVRKLKEKLIRQGAEAAAMSGSGSSVFGLFKSRRSAAQAFRRLRREKGNEVYLVRVLNQVSH
jgi:4-diphosphocytidyl-2-C-methyl-D-erythritol kinase